VGACIELTVYGSLIYSRRVTKVLLAVYFGLPGRRFRELVSSGCAGGGWELLGESLEILMGLHL
jgi:hypothetical protein